MPPKKGKSKSKIKGSRSTESAGPSAQSSEGGETLQESPPDPYMNTLPAGIEQTSGSEGKPVQVLANYFMMEAKKARVFAYKVAFEETIEARNVRCGLIYSVKARGVLGGGYVFDGGDNLKSVDDIGPAKEFTVIRSHDKKEIKIMLTRIGVIASDAPEMLRFYNTSMRRNLAHMGMVLIGRNYFKKKPTGIVPYRRICEVKVFDGFNTAINKHEGGLMMMVDIIFKNMNQQNAHEFIKGIIQENRRDWLNEARQRLAGQTVMTHYNQKIYRIDDIDREKHPDSKFERKGKGSISFIDYYKEQYPTVKITNPTQPMLVVMPSAKDRRAGRTDPIYLVPELCTLTGITEQMKTDFRFMKAVNDLSKLNPKNRVEKLITFMNDLQQNEKVQEENIKSGITFMKNLVSLNARVLDEEKLIMSGAPEAKEGPVIQNGDFARGMRNQKIPSAPPVQSIAFVVLKNDKATFDKLGKPMMEVCNQIGFPAFTRRPPLITLDNDRFADWKNAIDQVPKESSMIVFIVPNNKKDRYDAIKQICCIDKGIPSQVIVTKTLQKEERVMSVVTKIIIQMACKLGGEAWRIFIPPKELMVCGFDVYHDSGGSGRSAGAFVSTTSRECNQYFSQINFHQSHKELSQNFRAYMRNALDAFKSKNNGKLPMRIIIYRDGVGIGNIAHVTDGELKDALEGSAEFYGNQEVPMTFIIVSKRVNARFFKKAGSYFDNCSCGTVVDTKVTFPRKYIFYLISQSVRDGTVTPTMYDIIADSSKPWKPDNHQRLAYKLSHMYFNWQGTIKIPAPCQYAHKLAYLAGMSLHKEVNPKIQNLLYYL